MKTYAVIDIGSNSVRLVVFDASAAIPHYIYNEKAICQLGAGLERTGKLSPEGVIAAKSELERFFFLLEAMNVGECELIATAAIREASDGGEFCAWVKDSHGLDVRVLSGEEEAQIAAQGVLMGWGEASGWVVDLGGSSMEICALENGRIGQAISTRLGPLRLRNLDAPARAALIQNELERALDHMGKPPKTLFLVGGSFRAIARLDMQRCDYPLPILHEYAMTPDALRLTADLIAGPDFASRASRCNISSARAELLADAAAILEALIARARPERLVISAYGLREGMLFAHLPKKRRKQDPLIASCQAMEAAQARFPGFGKALFEWMAPLRANNSAGRDRLVRAACLLHDVNWRVHPDFRAKLAFETTLQGNFAAITHQGRAFLALAMASRYENRPDLQLDHPAISLLDDEERQSARELGRTLRLGAMIAGSTQDLLRKTSLHYEGEHLVLRITKASAAIYGESVVKRLQSLGKIAETPIEIRIN